MFKTMPNLIEANCESCAHCQRLYYENFIDVLLTTLSIDRKQLALGCCIRRKPNLLVTLVRSCKEWKNAEEVQHNLR